MIDETSKKAAEVLSAMPELSPDAWIVLTGAATNVACALVGCFLVLRRMSLMGDAIAHAVLPGLVIALLVSGSMNIVPMFLGAAAAGLLTTFLTQSLHQYARVPSDASMGVVFTSLFAIGVVLVKKFVSGVHFDVACVYEGALAYVPFVEPILGLPRPLFTTLVVLVVNLAVLVLLWKELKVSSFDENLASTMGFSATAMHYLLMMLVAVTAVASFEAVGSILVVAMLIVPAATAHLLCDRLGVMVFLSAVVGVAAAVLGYVAGSWLDTNYAGMMTVAVGVLYALAVLFSPRYGLINSLVRNVRMSLKVMRDDLLAMLYRVEELAREKPLSPAKARRAVGGGWLARWGLAGLVRSGQIASTDDRLQLTDTGREVARSLVRSHRLWETYLVEHLGMPLDHVHEPAHRVEHFIDEQLRRELEAKVDPAAGDPHGREIPEYE
ncbi:MAG: metal ABC transporter permease [Planctomycetes bacterium]|nr:metal ABC transporter permease [Planctomycetota bacterium]